MEDIVLIDDHLLLRQGLAQTIEAEADLNVAEQMNSAGEALAEIEDLAPWPSSTFPCPA